MSMHMRTLVARQSARISVTVPVKYQKHFFFFSFLFSGRELAFFFIFT
jgi:hypothetical protein